MLLSKSCEYGIRTGLHLAAEPDQRVPIRTISEALGMPYHFLAKIAQQLIAADLLNSVRGPHGGIALARPPEGITLKEIVVALDGPEIFTECVLGLPGCGNRKPCPLHDQWGPARDRIHDMFQGASLASVAARIAAGNFRLADFAASAPTS